MAWYTIQTKPNYEAKAIEGIEKRIAEQSLTQVREIFAPIENIVEYKDGKKVEKKKRLYTNYIFIEMDYSEELWHALKGVNGVVGFVGGRNKPLAVPLKDINIMKSQVTSEAPKHKVEFVFDARIRIKTGSFADFVGTVKSVDYERNKAKVIINIFGRETDVDLELSDIELAED